MKALAVLLCYNDGDMLEDVIRYLREQRHDIILWNHGSTDETEQVVTRLRGELVEYLYVPREFDFYKLYPAMSTHLIIQYTDKYDWVSWPDQDEFLEGSSRARSYYDALLEVYESGYDSIQFDNYIFWFTSADDSSDVHVRSRVRHYCWFPYCAPRRRAWRAAVTNKRIFNHNELPGKQWPYNFKLCHYPMRSSSQMNRRLLVDRANLARGTRNSHYEKMLQKPGLLDIAPGSLHCDNGAELCADLKFDWSAIYGRFKLVGEWE